MLPFLAALLPFLTAAGVGAAGVGGAALANKAINRGGKGKNRGTGNLPGQPGKQGFAPKGNPLTGSPEGLAQFPRFDPQTQQGLQSLLQGGLGMLGNQQQFDFGPIAQQAQNQFATQTIPSIAERFTSMGGGGGKSSAFGQQLGAAGADLQTNLASLAAQYGLQAQGQRNQLGLGMAQLGAQPQFENAYFPKQPGFLQQAGAGLAGSIPQAALLAGLYGLQNGWFSGGTGTPKP